MKPDPVLMDLLDYSVEHAPSTMERDIYLTFRRLYAKSLVELSLLLPECYMIATFPDEPEECIL